MVVGVTIATITYLMIGGKSGAGPTFVDPGSLREAIEDEIRDSVLRRAALDVVSSMEGLVGDYDEALRDSLRLYLERIHDYETTAASIMGEVIAPLERKRQETLLAYIGQRERLRVLLPEAEWLRIFGEPQAPESSAQSG